MESGNIIEQFRAKFGSECRLFRAPGRVNLIGEHTDYNDGFVMPAAIDFATIVAAAPFPGQKTEVYSQEYAEAAEFEVRSESLDKLPHWATYVLGVAMSLKKRGIQPNGAKLLIASDVPIGAGLSSSAALEVSTALALLGISDTTMPSLELARACQYAENEYTGARCGIMDQFISIHGKAGHCLMLDCRSLDYKLLPIPDSVSLVVCNSKVKHAIADGEYNVRRAHCEEGVALLQSKLPDIRALRDVSPEQLDEYRLLLPEIIYHRCRHVVTENARVLAAACTLEESDLAEFGRLMYDSHRSMRDDYEISCKEIDILVEIAANAPGVIGARMTGGGFGGCTVNLVERASVDAFSAHLREGYMRETGIQPDVYVCTPSGGAGEVYG